MNIEHISYFLPDKTNLVSELSQQGEFSRDEAHVFTKIMGLMEVPRDASQTSFDNIKSVFSLFFNEKSIDKNKVRYILMSHTADYIVPCSYHLSELIIQAFQFYQATCFGSVVNKCATPFHFFKIASVLFQALRSDELILIVNADTAFTQVVKSIAGCTVMGDAASVVMLSNQGAMHEVIDLEIQVDDRFHNGVFATQNEKLLFQSIYCDELCHIIKKIVDRNDLSLSQLKFIFPHNVNALSWKSLSQKMGFPIEKIYLHNIKKLGHCFGSDPFINLKDALAQNVISMGDYYLLVSVGLGATFSVMLCRY